MSESLGKAFVEVRGDLSHLGGDLSGVGRAFSGVAQKFTPGGILSGGAELAAGFAAAYAPIRLVEKAIEGYNEHAREGLEQANALGLAQARLRAALLSTGMAAGLSGEDLAKQSEQLSRATGVDGRAIIEFQQKLLSFQNVNGEVFKRATTVALDWSQMMGFEMPEAARLLGIALSNPEHGAERLRRAGVFLTSQQKEQVKEFMKVNDLAKAQGVLLGALESKFAGAGERLASPMKKLKSALSDAQVELGKTLQQREPLKLQVKLFVVDVEGEASAGFNRFLQGAGYLDAGHDPKATKEAASDFYQGFFKYGRQIIAQSVGSGLSMGMPNNPITESMNKFFEQSDKDYDDLKKANEERRGLDKEQQKIDERRAKKPTPADLGPGKVDKDVTGVFDLQALQNKIQESLLNKNDKLVELAEASKGIQEEMLDALRGGGDGESIPVARP